MVAVDSPDSPILPDLVPARMLNEFAYCPRLAHLEWVQGQFAPSADTLDGTFRHRAVNRPSGGNTPDGHTSAEDAEAPATSPHDATPDAPDDDSDLTFRTRSLHISAPQLGMTAVIDLLEGERAPDGQPPAVIPVDYKRGAVPDNPEHSWEPERVQLCAQGLILRENGYRCQEGVLYFAASKRRVQILFDPPLVARTLELLDQFRRAAQAALTPPPLDNSPKCNGCSLAPICLPDETRLLSSGDPIVISDPADEPRIRQLIPTRDDARPLYVQEQRGYVGKKGDVVQVRSAGREKPETLAEVRLAELSHVCLFGNVQISTQLVQELCDRQIPLCYFSFGGYFHGLTTGLPGKNIDLRIAQYQRAADPAFCLAIARAATAGKVENQRTLFRRNHPDPPTPALDDLAASADQARAAGSLPTLLGIEGNAARTYFRHFGGLLRPRAAAADWSFAFDGRNRRPPADPVNALLSLGYAILAKDFAIICWSIGLDPYLGFYHQPRFGRPALALDLMEEFRPLIVDSAVITAINTAVVTPRDFIRHGPACNLTASGRRAFILAYQRRLDSLVTHPLFGYRISYRRVLEVQARLLGRVLLGEVPAYVPFTTR